MNLSRRGFLGGLGAAGALSALPGCKCPFCCGPNAKVAVQLYSIHQYLGGTKDKNGKVIIPAAGLEKGLAEVAKIGYKGVEFAGYYNHSAAEIKKMLDDNGLVAVGTHIGLDSLLPDKIVETCEFNCAYGNHNLMNPGGGNVPPKCGWGREQPPASKEIDDFVKKLCDTYNTAAETAAKYGCRVGLHNHMWEHAIKMTDGTSYWDYFFTHTSDKVCMEQDVGWSTCAGVDPCEQYKKYPNRSPLLHAKENGMDGCKSFEGILGRPGEGSVGVDWDKLIVATEADGVEWYVVECERNFDSLKSIIPSYAFLRGKGLS